MPIIEEVKLTVPLDLGRKFLSRLLGSGLNNMVRILTDIPVEINVEEVGEQLHLNKESKDLNKLKRLLENVRFVSNPKAIYKISCVNNKNEDTLEINGVKFTSRILRMNLDKVERVFPYIVTCGRELDEIDVPSDDFIKRFWLETIKEIILRLTLKYLANYLKKKYALGQISSMHPGSLEDWPIIQQEQLFSILGNFEGLIGVRLTDSFLMVPTKSVSGIYFPAEIRFESCKLCPREECQSRRAPYDKGLAKKYRG